MHFFSSSYHPEVFYGSWESILLGSVILVILQMKELNSWRKWLHWNLSLAGCRIGTWTHSLDPYWIHFPPDIHCIIFHSSIPFLLSPHPPPLSYPFLYRGNKLASSNSCGSDDKASAFNAGDLGLITGLGRSPREGNGNPLQYSCLENPMDGGAC